MTPPAIGESLEPPEEVPPVSAERLVDGELPVDGAESLPRRYPSTIGGAFYLVALAIVVFGLCTVLIGSWRTGIRWVAGAMILAAVARLVLPNKDAGMLAVRSRWLDVVILAVLAGALIFLAGSIPEIADRAL